MARRTPLALGLLLAVLAAGCGGGEQEQLIPQDKASQLTATVDEIAEACEAEEPDQVREAVAAANQQVSELPRGTDPDLEANLREWLAHIEGRVRNDCEPQEDETPTPTPTPTVTEEPTETPTAEPTETATPEPTETATPAPEETPEVPPVEPPGEGGVPAPEDTDG